MTDIVRFGVSLPKELLNEFDRHIKSSSYSSRSKAIEDLIREDLIDKTWTDRSKISAGIITLVYNNHKRELSNNLVCIQHDNQDLIISSQHVHLSHENCLEVIVVKGKSGKIKKLADKLKSEKGVKHVSLIATIAG